jgi:hypothetical protein
VGDDGEQSLRLGLQITQQEQVDRATDFSAQAKPERAQIHLVVDLYVNDQVNVTDRRVGAFSR